MRKLALIILDGWGLGEEKPNNAIHMARTPFFDYLWENFPRTQLEASGTFVGLPQGQIGGSEVGHLTIGAGRTIYQQLPRITRSLEQREREEGIFNIRNFVELLQQGKRRTIHFIGLISTGGVHSHQDHLFKMLEVFKEYGTKSPLIHFISDGRDTPPTSGIHSARLLIKKITEMKFGRPVTLSGRFFTMDRDKNWDRTGKAVRLITEGKAKFTENHQDVFSNLTNAMEKSYKNGITDEFIEPVLIDPAYHGIGPDDILFFFNFRNDRMKQIVTKIHEKLPNPIYTLTRYDKDYKHPVIFEKETLDDTIGHVFSKLNLTQLKAAETEKAPHVTFFFNGGVETVFKGEVRAVAESHKVKHDTIPTMKAAEIHKNIRDEVMKTHPDFILVNFANPDMVGHTGNFNAVIAGVEEVDRELKSLCTFLTKHGYVCCVTADHGNADIMYNLETHEPHTAHTLNPVPFIVYDPIDVKNQRLLLDRNPENGLSLIAGTVLDLMELKKHGNNFKSLLTSKH